MTTLALMLILVSACLHATWNYLSKKANGGTPFMWLFTAIATVLYAPLFIGAILYFDFTFTYTNILFIFGSIILHLLYFLLLFQGYKVGNLSVVYPVSRGLAPMLTVICAILLFNESPTVIAFIGITCIVLGIFFLTGGIKIFRNKESFLPVCYGILIGITISGYTLLDKAAVSVIMISPLILDYFNTIGRLILLTPNAFKQWNNIKREWYYHRKEAIGVGVLNSLTYILVLSALTFTPVSYVAPVREISILFGTFIGVKLLKEGFGFQRAISSTIIVVGILIIAFTTL